MSAPVPLVAPPCALCGGDDFVTVLRDVRDWIWLKPGSFTLQRCASCGLVATRPRPADDALGFYYETTYSGGSNPLDAKGFYDSPAGRLLLAYRLATLGKVRRLTPEDRLLDVGSSYGSFVAFARDRTGCRASGIDIDAGSIAQAVSPDTIDYRTGRLADGDYPDHAFTVVTFIECLEHEPDPVGALREAYRILEPGGVVVVEVPNYRSVWRAVFRGAWMPLLVPQHLHHFTPATLRAVAERAGFTVAHWQAMLFPLEFVASLAIALATVFGPARGEAAPLGRRLYEKVANLLLFSLWWVAEVPSQVLLRLAGWSGHQTLVAQKPPRS